MDGRERLAQSLKQKAARRMRPAHAHAAEWPDALRRLRRFAQRMIGRLIALEPPRGVGASAAALMLLASTCYGVVKGGHVDVVAAQLQDICDSTANLFGFRISEVAIAGRHEVSRQTVLALAGITGNSSLPFLNAAHVRARLLSDPWIAKASVLKLYPGRVHIAITERKAFALWQQNGQVSLIAADGTVLEPYVPRRFATLPLMVGRGAENTGHAFLALVDRHPTIAHLVAASVRVANRRWDLHLKNGIDVLLPEHDPERALQTLASLDQSKNLLTRDIVKVDLRLPDRVAVQLSDAAAAARDAAFKAEEKKKKQGAAA